MGQLSPVFKSLGETKSFPQALAEKSAAVATWNSIRSEVSSLRMAIPDDAAESHLVAFRRHLESGALYGEILSQIIEGGWRALSIGYQNQTGLAPLNATALQ